MDSNRECVSWCISFSIKQIAKTGVNLVAFWKPSRAEVFRLNSGLQQGQQKSQSRVERSRDQMCTISSRIFWLVVSDLTTTEVLSVHVSKLIAGQELDLFNLPLTNKSTVTIKYKRVGPTQNGIGNITPITATITRN